MAKQQAGAPPNQVPDKPNKPIRDKPSRKVQDINDNSGAQVIAPMAGPIGDYARIAKTRRVYQHMNIDDVPTAIVEIIAEATDDWGTPQYTIESVAVCPATVADTYHVILVTMLEGRVQKAHDAVVQ